MARQPVQISKKEFRKAFNAFAQKGAMMAVYPDIKPALEKAFRGKGLNAKASSDKLFKIAMNISESSLDGEPAGFNGFKRFNGFKYELATNFLATIPAIAEEIVRDKKREEKKRERQIETSRKESSRPKSLEERVAQLERENAALRGQVNNQPRTAEQILAEREYYEKNDTRIGGYSPPSPRTFRD